MVSTSDEHDIKPHWTAHVGVILWCVFRVFLMLVKWPQFSSDCKPKLIPQAGNVYHLLFTVSAYRTVSLIVLADGPYQECDTHTPSITNAESNGVKYYDTNDLIMPHPSNPSLWKVLGRTDDLILHSNGQKVRKKLHTSLHSILNDN